MNNLGRIAWDKLNDEEYSYDWAAEASFEIKKHILDGKHQKLVDYLSLGNALRLAVPTPEHYLPLLYALALQDKNEEITLFNDRIIAGSISMTSVKIG